MKANRAPEKLYLLPNGLISYRRNTDEGVEYTRTDAFIEKAKQWLRCNNDLNDDDVADYVESFENYMKGVSYDVF